MYLMFCCFVVYFCSISLFLHLLLFSCFSALFALCFQHHIIVFFEPYVCVLALTPCFLVKLLSSFESGAKTPSRDSCVMNRYLPFELDERFKIKSENERISVAFGNAQTHSLTHSLTASRTVIIAAIAVCVSQSVIVNGILVRIMHNIALYGEGLPLICWCCSFQMFGVLTSDMLF